MTRLRRRKNKKTTEVKKRIKGKTKEEEINRKQIKEKGRIKTRNSPKGEKEEVKKRKKKC